MDLVRDLRGLAVLTLALSLLATSCKDDEVTGDDDTGATDDDDDSAGPMPDHDFTAVVESADGAEGTIVLRFTPAWEKGSVREFEVAAGAPVTIDGLAPGPYGLLAWLDTDGDGEWDGIWEGDGEPAARLGLELPRNDLYLVVRSGVPSPILDGDPQWIDLYHRAWELAGEHVAAGTAANSFAGHYMDEAFSEQIFQWDTCFMTLFGLHGLDAFPVMASLDNFYGTQAGDGYICRVVNESDGLPGGDASDPAEPMINPPLFAWSELLYVRQTGDLSRLPTRLGVLDVYHAWIDANVRTEPDLYYTSMLGSGMDNAPRDTAYDGWVDITAQQAMARRQQAELATLFGDASMAEDCEAEAERICEDVRTWMWDDAEGFFFDLDADGALLTDKTLASVWPLLAGCATEDQASRVIDHLQDPAEFWRVHVFPSTAADSPHYDPAGYYWRGGVWAPTNYASITALDQAGRHDLAAQAAENHITALERVHSDFEPAEGQLADEAIGDGTGTLWELYAPDAFAPGTRWDATYLGRQDFVGWTGLGPIALLLEQVIGLQADALDDTLTWRLARTDRHGVVDYRFGDQLVTVVASGRAGPAEPATIELETTDPFTLVIEMGGSRWSHDVPLGISTVEVDPASAPLAVDTVAAGPFPGYAVLGNGAISAVWSDDDGSDTPPGLAHLYRGGFGLELVDGGRTRVAQDGDLLGRPRVGTDPFFAAYSELDLPCGGALAWRAFVGEQDAVVVQGSLAAGDDACAVQVFPHVTLRTSPHIDGSVSLLASTHEDGVLLADLDDGTGLALGASPAPSAWQIGDIDPSALPDGLTSQGEGAADLALQIDLEAGPGDVVPFRWVLATGDGSSAAADTVEAVVTLADPLEDAAVTWDAWSPANLCGSIDDLCRVAAANLYASRSSSLGGSVPADLTGQFVTNDFPQLYPRDALMVARALEMTGHDDEAWEIVHDWLGRDGPQPGEWYARYDALGRAVDGGTGAAYDVPEWDANGYLAVLVERLGSSQLSTDEREALLQGLDLLVDLQDADGLWWEGGIIEWEGRLPGTAMTSWAGLDAGARLAADWGEDARAEQYRAAAGRLRGGLLALFDFDRLLLADERDGGLAYDTSMLFGPAWGYPAGPLLDSSLDWILAEATAHGGGVRYFEGMDYGQDLFFFTTAAAAEYAAALGDTDTAEDLLQWMASFSNRYGLAPERVYADGWGAAEASPLSWCAAEVAIALLALVDALDVPVLPDVDGVVSAAEYRRWGPAVVDGDGDPDDEASPIAMYAARDDDLLRIALRVAGDAASLPGTVSFYLAEEDGVGSAPTTEGGLPLTFRCDAGDSPGAAARIQVTPSEETCWAGAATADGYESYHCDYALGENWVEVSDELGTLDMSGPFQVIAVVDDGSAEQLLPAHGSLLSDGAGDGVIVTFEVDATAIAAQLDPDTGVVVTLSGDRSELGAWAGNAVGLVDDGTGGDLLADDGVWTVRVALPERGAVEYKYLVGVVGDGSWDGAEFDGDNRHLWIQDADGTGRVRIRDTFGVLLSSLTDP